MNLKFIKIGIIAVGLIGLSSASIAQILEAPPNNGKLSAEEQADKLQKAREHLERFSPADKEAMKPQQREDGSTSVVVDPSKNANFLRATINKDGSMSTSHDYVQGTDKTSGKVKPAPTQKFMNMLNERKKSK